MAGFYENAGDPGNKFGESAEAFATESKNWANTPEDTPVPEGSGSEFSSLHYAEKGEENASNAATSESNASTSETNAASSQAAAAASEANAAQSETNAGNSETNAAASETAAANSETAALSSENDSEASAENSEGSAADAAISANISAGNANFIGEWSAQTGAAAVPTSVLHEQNYWQLLNDLADITTSEPGVTSDWAMSGLNLPQVHAVALSF